MLLWYCLYCTIVSYYKSECRLFSYNSLEPLLPRWGQQPTFCVLDYLCRPLWDNIKYTHPNSKLCCDGFFDLLDSPLVTFTVRIRICLWHDRIAADMFETQYTVQTRIKRIPSVYLRNSINSVRFRVDRQTVEKVKFHTLFSVASSKRVLSKASVRDAEREAPRP